MKCYYCHKILEMDQKDWRLREHYQKQGFCNAECMNFWRELKEANQKEIRLPELQRKMQEDFK